jgi:hypothetical protein
MRTIGAELIKVDKPSTNVFPIFERVVVPKSLLTS